MSHRVRVAIAILFGTLLPLLGSSSPNAVSATTAAEISMPLSCDSTATEAYQTKCCKICTVGKACGNSCISRDKICHQPRGCACDG